MKVDDTVPLQLLQVRGSWLQVGDQLPPCSCAAAH